MASPAEREMREMLMRTGGDDPDERSKHGVPRQQDLTQLQPPPQSPSQPQKEQLRQAPKQQPFHQEPGPQMKQDVPRQEPMNQQQESEQNQEPQQTPRQKQRVRVQDDSDADGRRKRLRVITGDPTKGDPQKMETDQESQSVPEPHEFARRFDGKKQLDLPPVPEDVDLNATVIEMMTDIEVLLDGSSVIDVLAVKCARRKRVEKTLNSRVSMYQKHSYSSWTRDGETSGNGDSPDRDCNTDAFTIPRVPFKKQRERGN